jgi:hypothetical protein
MSLFPQIAIFLILLCAVTSSGIAEPDSAAKILPQSGTSPSIPVQTDDGLDPISLIFTGYAPSWWVAANMKGWSDSAYCSQPKTVEGNGYNYTLEHPDPTGLACIGPRDHIRIWDMGYSPSLGEWSIASAHHEHTVCNPVCHHVIDSWNNAETDARSALLKSQTVASVTNYPIANAGYYQSVYFNGNATLFQLKPPSTQYPTVFNEDGLGNQTAWAVTVNGTTSSSTRPVIVFEKLDGVYPFNVSIPTGFVVSPSSGTITVIGGATQNIHFRTPWTTTTATINMASRTFSIRFYGNATVAKSSVELSTIGDTTISFTASEMGAMGTLNVSIPKSIAPFSASSTVYVDGSNDYSQKLSSDSSSYYLYFLLLYGTHSVQLKLSTSAISFLQYFTGGAIASGIIVAVFIAFRSKVRRRQVSTIDSASA